jgi:hypothetical protein
MAHKMIVPPKKNYVPQFLKQRDINSYFNIIQSLLFVGPEVNFVKENFGKETKLLHNENSRYRYYVALSGH